MTLRLPHFAIVCFLALISANASYADRAIPAAPIQYVLDEPSVIDTKSSQWLTQTLTEHERLTGEQIVVAVFDELGGQDAIDFTNQVFTSWKIGKKNKNNGVLIALYWKDRKSRIEVGYGVEPLLTDLKSSQVLREVLAPRLKAGQPGAALSAAVWEVLTILGSPIVESGHTKDLPFEQNLDWGASPAKTILLLLFGIGVVLVLLFRVASPEAHYTSAGWYRPDPLRRIRTNSGWGGGGLFGGGGSGGGFLGGGGMSGGGGASGDW